MSLWQAILYFLREAAVSLVRSWKVSLLAVLTIAMSLFVGGGFLLVGSNLAALAADWQRQARVVVYLQTDTSPEQVAELASEAGAQGWAAGVEVVDQEEAARRFRRSFPSLADLVEGEEAARLPPTVEVLLAADADPAAVDAWSEEVRQRPGVDMVDDDRDWLRQLETLITLVRGAGVTLAAILLGAAIFTIAAIIRLTAFLYHDEIAVMRLVGATEFYIRGPFYAEGLLQGLLGGLLAVAGLFTAYRLALPDDATLGLVSRVLRQGFLDWRTALTLVLLGGVAGLLGAMVSLRREQLDEVAEVGEGAQPAR